MIKISEREKINQFWDWFNQHKYYYEEMENEWDPGLELLAEKISRINKNIEAMIHINNFGKHEIIITCNGIIDYFPLVRAVVKESPELIGWKTRALVQPTEEFSVAYNEFLLDSREMFFMPFFDEDYFKVFLYAKDIEDMSDQDSDYLARRIVIKSIGEYHFATKVAECILCDLNNAIEPEELLPLDQLHAFVMNNFMNSN
jgi:hypothetical protein